MIREIGGKLEPAGSRTLRCGCCGHTVKVSTSGNLGDGQSANPTPNITIEDLGYYKGLTTQESHEQFHKDNGGRCPWGCDTAGAKFYQVGPQPPLPVGKTSTNVEGTEYVLSAAGKQAVIDEAMRAAGSPPNSTSGPIDFRRAIDGLDTWQKTWIGD